MKLQDTIKGLLSLKREGGYWDFKNSLNNISNMLNRKPT